MLPSENKDYYYYFIIIINIYRILQHKIKDIRLKGVIIIALNILHLKNSKLSFKSLGTDC